MTIQMAFTLTPFVLAALLVRDLKDGIKVLRLTAIAGLIYSPLMVIEVVMSPQLHTWIYGFFPHSFGQQMRFGGYRPVVFMGHGLLVANFAVVTLLATTGLWKAKQKIFVMPMIFYVLWSLLMLIICKSVGAWLLGILGFLLLTFLPSRLSTLGAYLLASAVFFYPILAIFNYIPHDKLLELAALFGPEKAGSLGFRFHNEEVMVAHGQERILFGWGGWDRNRIDGVVTDGYWIIKFSQFGLLGYLVFLGLPMLAVKNGQALLGKTKNRTLKQVIATYCVIIAMLMVDQIPNASQHNWVFFLYGAAVGLFANARKQKKVRQLKTPNIQTSLNPAHGQ
ncbi:hypothetical protein GCM10008940_18410 [Microbulbifer agarilyticus]